MRKILNNILIKQLIKEDYVFLTGDLGFMALEELKESMGERFINAGVAEQNMISVAAGLAMEGLRPWVYSIGPFIYARPYEQIRNDICLHDLPVVLIGNGGGYSYGAMGSTHHALEDYGSLLCLQNLNVFIPAFGYDVIEIVDKLLEIEHPSYLRLGRCEGIDNGKQIFPYSQWRQVLFGKGPTVVSVGTITGGLIEKFGTLESDKRPNLWVITELPINKNTIPDDFFKSLEKTQHLFVIEEHIAQGSVGQILCQTLSELSKMPVRFTHKHAIGYPTGLYGSQKFHRIESGIDPDGLRIIMEGYGHGA